MCHALTGASQVELVVKNPPANVGDIRDTGLDWIPGSGRSSGGGHGNPLQYSSWKIQWTEDLGGLQSMGLQRVGHDWSDLACIHVITIFVFVFNHEDLLIWRRFWMNLDPTLIVYPQIKIYYFLFSNLLAASDKVSKSAV